uniref:Sulfatase domain-containing protein n=1 Tax=Steinernema glaseri TaxID=37863 RepID=A0A1I7YFW2_9BILA
MNTAGGREVVVLSILTIGAAILILFSFNGYFQSMYRFRPCPIIAKAQPEDFDLHGKRNVVIFGVDYY